MKGWVNNMENNDENLDDELICEEFDENEEMEELTEEESKDIQGGNCQWALISGKSTLTVASKTGESVNVRSGPGIDYRRIGRLAGGSRVIYLEKKVKSAPKTNNRYVWYKIRYYKAGGPIEGWISGTRIARQ